MHPRYGNVLRRFGLLAIFSLALYAVHQVLATSASTQEVVKNLEVIGMFVALLLAIFMLSTWK